MHSFIYRIMHVIYLLELPYYCTYWGDLWQLFPVWKKWNNRIMAQWQRLYALSQSSVLIAVLHACVRARARVCVCGRGDTQSVAGNWRPTGVVRVRDQIGNPATLSLAIERQPVTRNFVVLENCWGNITTKTSKSPQWKSKHHSKPLGKH
jgi:hypothetical protein